MTVSYLWCFQFPSRGTQMRASVESVLGGGKARSWIRLPSTWQDTTSCPCQVALSVPPTAVGATLGSASFVLFCFNFCQFDGWDIISCCCFNLHFSDTSKVEPLFSYDYWPYIRVSFPRRYLFTTSAEFSVGLVVFLICRSPLYILETNLLLVVCIASISSQIVAYLSILFMVFFVELKIWMLMSSNSLYFPSQLMLFAPTIFFPIKKHREALRVAGCILFLGVGAEYKAGFTLWNFMELHTYNVHFLNAYSN